MPKPKPKGFAGLLDAEIANEPAAPITTARPRAASADNVTTSTVLVGANLPPSYARNLAMLHAETGRSKKQLLQEALDMLFVAKGGPGLKRG